jgi:Flp pilus assembly protein TadD
MAAVDLTELAPTDAAALRQFGLALHEAGQLAEAVKIYRQVTTIDPTDVTILNNLCACLCNLGRFDEATAACERALALDPDHAKALVNRGVIFEQQNDIEAAIDAYRRAIEADPAWVLLPHAQDWRWLRDREDSPWYPSLRLFRQEKPQAWEGVVARVAMELEQLAR